MDRDALKQSQQPSNIDVGKKDHLLDRYAKQDKGQQKDADNSPFYKNSAPSIELPKGGGALKGIDEKFTVNAVNGTSALDISLPITPGRSGFTPALSLQYNSGSGNSEFGLGWGLSLPSIQRKTDKKLPQYRDDLESDTFLLAGAEDLIPKMELDGTWDYVDDTVGDYYIKQYRPRIEGLYARIEKITKNTGYSWWRVTSKENIITYYGLTSAACIADPNDGKRIFKWLPQLVIDNKGNVQEYAYVAEDDYNIPVDIHEKNRTSETIGVNRYLSRISYCNRVPYFIDGSSKYEPTLPSSVNYLMEVVFDYGDFGHATNISNDTPTTTRDTDQWLSRKDPFSDFHAGFEIRTYRRCRRVLMFHHFTELGGHDLVRSLDIEYAQDSYDSSSGTYAEADYIVSLTQKGYKYNGSSYIRRSLPALTFTCNPLDWNTDIVPVSREDVKNAPQGLTGAYQWIDLWGEGLPGILAEQNGGWFYKTNNGNGGFTPAMPVASKPSISGLGSSLQWQDLDADGRRQVVSREKNLPGYFELNDDQEWLPFRAFKENLNVDWNSPYTKMLDLDGDGKADLLMTDEMVWTWYKNIGKEGFTTGGKNTTAYDEENGPRLVLNDSVQSIFLADMNGDGLTDIGRSLLLAKFGVWKIWQQGHNDQCSDLR
jgi:hypothetical protein